MSVLSLPEARSYCNILEADAAAIEELQTFIGAAEVAIGKRIGPLEPEIVTERHLGGGPLVLRKLPARELKSIVAVGSGEPVDLASVDLDPQAGIVEQLSGRPFPARRYDVTFVAGWENLPDDVLIAVKGLVMHLWETQRKTSARKTGSDAPPGAAYAMPYRVEQLLTPYRLPSF